MSAQQSGETLPSRFSVGDWSVDCDGLSITDGDRALKLEPRALGVLRYLAERPGKLITIDELMDALWADVVVTPNAVTRVIAQLRRALGDDAKNPHYIQTVARTGYRLIAPVEADATPPRQATAATAVSGRMLMVGMGAIAAVIVLTLLWLLQEPGQPTVAVLPFENLTGDPSLDYLGEGVAEEVIHSLAVMEGLSVSARSESFRRTDNDQTALQIADELDVAWIVAGSVRQAGAELRFSAQLVDVQSGRHRWSDSIHRNSRQTFEAQDEISRAVAGALADELDLPVPSLEKQVYVPDPEAYRLYLQGRYVWHRRGSEPLQPAIDAFAEAVRIDPEFARGWSALASAYLTYPSYSPRGYASWNDAEDAARKALELDPDLSEPYAVLGTFADTRLDWVTGHDYYATGVAFDERSATANYWYSEHLAKTGRYADSVRHMQRTRELDPTYIAPQLDEAFAFLMFGDYERGAEQFVELWTSGVHNVTAWQGLFTSSVLTGNIEQARQVVDIGRLPDDAKALLHRYLDFEVSGLGAAELTDDLFNQERLPMDYRMLTWVGSRLGSHDEVISMMLDRIHKGQHVETRPMWGPGTTLRQHRGFVELLDALGLIEYWETVAWGTVCRRDEQAIVCDDAAMTPADLRRIIDGVDRVE